MSATPAVPTISLTNSLFVSRDPHHWADTDGSADVGRHKAHDQRKEQQPAPAIGQSDQCEGKYQRDRVENQHDSSARAKIRLDHFSGSFELAEPRLDVKDHPDEKQTYKAGRDLRNDEEEGVRHRIHG